MAEPNEIKIEALLTTGYVKQNNETFSEEINETNNEFCEKDELKVILQYENCNNKMTKKELPEECSTVEVENFKSPGNRTNIESNSIELPMGETAHKTPHSHKKIIVKKTMVRKRNVSKNTVLSQTITRSTPKPLANWSIGKDIWQNMVFKEEATLKNRNHNIFEQGNTILPRMRAILIDWIMEVCCVYRLRRVTYYLAVDYIDRYLTIKPNLPKTQMQLVGVSALFISAKLEEIYPPKLSEFTYVCDGACTSDEILACELLILINLGWDLNPTTPSGWLNLYIQIYYKADDVIRQALHEQINREFEFPQFSGYKFSRASLIMDLFSLDPGYLKFSYSVIAASAMYFIFGKQVALDVSGIEWSNMKLCVEYMAVFYKVIRESYDPLLLSVPSNMENNIFTSSLTKRIPNIIKDENHSYQTHNINLQYFEQAVLLRLEAQQCYIINTNEKLVSLEKLLEKSEKEELDNTAIKNFKKQNISPENDTTKEHSAVSVI